MQSLTEIGPFPSESTWECYCMRCDGDSLMRTGSALGEMNHGSSLWVYSLAELCASAVCFSSNLFWLTSDAPPSPQTWVRSRTLLRQGLFSTYHTHLHNTWIWKLVWEKYLPSFHSLCWQLRPGHTAVGPRALASSCWFCSYKGDGVILGNSHFSPS